MIAKDIQHVDEESLLTGKAGIALFYYYLNTLINKKEYKEKAIRLIEECISAISNKKMSADFGSGFIGIAWCLSHLSKNGFITINSDLILEDLDKYTLYASEESLKKNNFDTWYGGIGGGIYFLNRLPHSFAETALNKFVDQLYINAERDGDELKWSNDFISIHPKVAGQKEYNLGLSHGIPSIISFLSMAYYNGISKEKCLKLLKGSINWLLKQRLNRTALSCFPNVVSSGIESESSRLAWCYGDLGIAISIWNAGYYVDNEFWKNEAIKILIHSSKRKDWDANSVWDSCLCHGSVGVAHIFNRFFQQTGIEDFKESAIFWLRVAFKQKFEDGLAGYKTYTGDNEWTKKSGLLEGIAGVGLSLISTISDIEPKWDKIFLLS